MQNNMQRKRGIHWLSGTEAGGRCPFPRAKWLEIHSLWMETPRQKQQDYEGRRLPPFQITYLLFLKSGDLPNHMCTERLLADQRAVMSRSVSYPYSFLVKFILAKRCMHKYGRILRYTKWGLWTRQIKMIDQRKPRRNDL